MTPKLLTPAERQYEMVARMARVFTRVNRVLTGEEIVCTTEDQPHMHAPAWSDGRTVTFNTAHIGSVSSTDDIIKITGLNYHELSHIMFTPRQNTELTRKVIDQGHKQTYNILEDQRIETLLTAMYPATKPYFMTTFMRYCLSDQEQWKTVHVLARGRHYIPQNIRDQFEDRYERQEDVQAINDIIDEYRLLVFPTDSDRAFELIEAMSLLLNNITPPSDPFGHAAGRPEVQKGRPLGKRDQEDAKEWAEWYDDEDEEEEDESEGAGDGDDEDSEDFDSDSDGDAEDSDTEDGEDEKGRGKGKKADDESDTEEGDGEGESDADSDEESESSTTESGGSGTSGPGASLDDDELAKALEEQVNNVEQSEQVQKEAKQKQSSIVEGDGDYERGLRRAKYVYNDVEPMTQNISKKFARELEKIRVDLDPGWKKHQASGRLNVARAMNADNLDLDTVFDQWTEGHNDRSDIECVLFIDSSGSMMGAEIKQACEAAWAIKKAMESIDASVTTLTFDSDCKMLYDRNDRAEVGRFRQVAATGGTYPTYAIQEAYRIFDASKRHTKIAIFVSDGGWSGGDDMVKRLNEFGVVTAHAYIGYMSPYASSQDSTYEQYYRHNCKVFETINTASDLIPFARRVVTEVMKGMK